MYVVHALRKQKKILRKHTYNQINLNIKKIFKERYTKGVQSRIFQYLVSNPSKTLNSFSDWGMGGGARKCKFLKKKFNILRNKNMKIYLEHFVWWNVLASLMYYFGITDVLFWASLMYFFGINDVLFWHHWCTILALLMYYFGINVLFWHHWCIVSSMVLYFWIIDKLFKRLVYALVD